MAYADTNKFKQSPLTDIYGNKQILIKPRLVIKDYHKWSQAQYVQHSKIFDGLWAINGYKSPFIHLHPDKVKINQSGRDLSIVIKEDIDGFNEHLGLNLLAYKMEVEKQQFTMHYQAEKRVYPECRMIFTGIPRKYYNYQELKQLIMEGFARKIHNKTVLRMMKQYNHPCYSHFVEIHRVNPFIRLPLETVGDFDDFAHTDLVKLNAEVAAYTSPFFDPRNITAVQRERTDEKKENRNKIPPNVHVSVKNIPEEYFKDKIMINDAVVDIVYDTQFLAESTLLQRIPQCYHCWDLGHFDSKCHRLEYVWCRKCGGRDHTSHQCKNDAQCAMCGGKHRAYKSSCTGLKPLVAAYRTGKALVKSGKIKPSEAYKWSNSDLLGYDGFTQKILPTKSNDNSMEIDENNDEEKNIEDKPTDGGGNTKPTANITTTTSTPKSHLYADSAMGRNNNRNTNRPQNDKDEINNDEDFDRERTKTTTFGSTIDQTKRSKFDHKKKQKKSPIPKPFADPHKTAQQMVQSATTINDEIRANRKRQSMDPSGITGDESNIHNPPKKMRITDNNNNNDHHQQTNNLKVDINNDDDHHQLHEPLPATPTVADNEQ